MVLARDTLLGSTAEFGYDDWPTRSRCHPFAAYVLKYMASSICRYPNVGAGISKIQIDPKPPKGIAFCHGALPTPKGLIRVGWENREGY